MSIKKIIREFFEPRFSTQEIESSKLKCNLRFETTDLFYDDGKRGFPTHILGYVKTRPGRLLSASWNQHGECTVKGIRVKSYDMVRPTQSQMDSGKSVITSLVVGLIVILVCIIF